MKTFSARETVWLQELDGIELAGFRRRAFAFLIDWIIVGILLSLVLALGALAYIGVAKALGHPTGFSLNFGNGDIESKADQLDKAGSPDSLGLVPRQPAAPAKSPAAASTTSQTKGSHMHFQLLRPDENFYEKLASEAVHIIADVLVPCLYFGLFFWRWNGQTPGKRLLKIRVVSLVHPRMTFWHSVERALGYGAAALEAGFGFIQYWIHPYRRCAQDRLAETIVVTERSYRKTFPTAPHAPNQPTAF